MSYDQWLLFVAIWIAASVPLGPNALNCIASSATDGFSRSLWTVLGIAAAALCHMAATTLGVSAILQLNATLFLVLKLAGAAYLIWMGISMWRKNADAIAIEKLPPAPASRLVRRGFLISMSNPKAIFAYLAVFSQFLDRSSPLADQLLILVPTALVILALVYGGYCAIGLGIGRLLKTARRRVFFNRGVGGFFVLGGIGLITAETNTAFARSA